MDAYDVEAMAAGRERAASYLRAQQKRLIAAYADGNDPGITEYELRVRAAQIELDRWEGARQ